MSEIWKNIEGYGGAYQVSHIGRIRSVRKGVTRVMATQVNNSGYLLCHLSKNNLRKALTVHRLVALHFVEKKEGCEFVDHINCNKLDNRMVNLQWVTRKINSELAVKNGLLKNHSARGKRIMKDIGSKYGFDNSQKHLMKAIPVRITIAGELKEFRSLRAASTFLGIQHTTLKNRIKRGVFAAEFLGVVIPDPGMQTTIEI